ncbi:MAG: carboxypeptidase-like regulatory domain-containing protein [Prolixibacteraceae bacterium]|nr:carboxypeptidase-like regulatory domain-containing protein [Prolixibacteraceae bacterium]
MKTLTYITGILLLLLAVNLHGQQGNDVLSYELSFPADSITKSALLDSVTQKTGVHFSYNPVLFEASQIIKPDSKRVTLYSLISSLINPEILTFHALNNQVIIYPLKNEVVEEPVSYKILRGSIIETKNDEPIPFCNIAILGRAIGTISNQDGKFVIKIPKKYWSDTLRFSCLGFSSFDLPLEKPDSSEVNIKLVRETYKLKTIDVFHYNPVEVLDRYIENFDKNYEKDYTLLTTYYREIIKENENYTDVSEAVLNVLKAPYGNEIKNDHVKFLKGRKSANLQPFNEIKFRLKGGPYYITRLDIVKNHESFISEEFRDLYLYNFEKITLIAGRKTVVISFKPIFNLRELLYEGLLYFDIETWALSRVEFNFTRKGLTQARRMMIEKEPRDCKAIPTELKYVTQYRQIDGKWYLNLAISSMRIRINNREKREKTNFHSISEMLVTNIEKGDLQHFSRKEIFKPNEFFTEKINGYDKNFWETYNVIKPEDDLENAIKKFDSHDIIIVNNNK